MLRHASSRWKIGRTPRVCIVGAGVAGLRCADVLIQNGIDVTILEARDRTGGRVYQTNKLGHTVDLGANWIHGTDKNPILDLAKETNTATCSVGEVSCTYDEDGHLMDPEKAGAISEMVWGTISDAFKYSNESSSIPADRSLKDYFVEKLDEKDIDEEQKRLVVQAAEMFGAFIGDPIDKQSLKYFWLEESLDGENLFVAGTYEAILAQIAKAAQEGAKIKLSTTVKSIGSKNHMTENVQIRIETSDSSSPLEFDAAVITTPLGCLKLQSPAITPPISPRLELAIQNVSYGRLEKAYITFPSAFWTPSNPTEENPPYPFFTNFLHPKYAPHVNPSCQTIDIVSLADLPQQAARPTLLFYLYGNLAADLTNLLEPHDPGSETYHSLLDNFLKPYYSLLPNFSASNPDCKPTAGLATAWQKDPLAGHGSYTNFQVRPPGDRPHGDDDYQLDEDLKALRHGMPERAIWFAGEHCAPYEALGTVTGAWWSGDAIGRRVGAWFEGREKEADEDVVGKADETTDSVQIGKAMGNGKDGVEV